MVLKNGATVLELDNTSGVVLAHWPRNGRTEYVTWAVDNEGNCYWGHYFHTEAEARDDYLERLAKK